LAFRHFVKGGDDGASLVLDFEFHFFIFEKWRALRLARTLTRQNEEVK
jgi:hypothetical protein